MKNWTQRLAIFALLGAVLSSAVLVGCSKGEDDSAPAANNTATSANSADG